MIELRTYTIQELAFILKTSVDRQLISKRLDNLGIKYSLSGRGETTQFEIKAFADEFKVFCNLDLGFDLRTEFTCLAYFLFLFFNDEDFQIQPLTEMENRLNDRNRKVSRQTLSIWKKKLEALGLFSKSTECRYYSVSKGNRREITREEYSKAWIAFYKYLAEHKNEDDFHYTDGFGVMYDLIGGKAIKRPLIDLNGFHSDTIDKISELTSKIIDNDIKTAKSAASDFHIEIKE